MLSYRHLLFCRFTPGKSHDSGYELTVALLFCRPFARLEFSFLFTMIRRPGLIVLAIKAHAPAPRVFDTFHEKLRGLWARRKVRRINPSVEVTTLCRFPL